MANDIINIKIVTRDGLHFGELIIETYRFNNEVGDMELIKYLSGDILKKIRRRTYSSGEIIRGIGEKKVIYIVRGEVKGVRYEKGREIVFPYILRKGDFIGEYGHYLPEKEDWETIALDRVEVFIFSQEEAAKYLFKNPEVQEFLIKKLLDIIGVSTRAFYIQSRGGARSALAYLLLDLIEGKDEITLKEYVNFSDMLGISKSMLYRITREFEGKGIVERKKETLWISDMDMLRSYYEEYLY